MTARSPESVVDANTRVYRVKRDSWEKVHCTVHRGDEPIRWLENVGYHSPDGFEMGFGGSGPADLALTILLDHLGVDLVRAREAYRNQFQTGNPGILVAWMNHHRLKEQRLCQNKSRCEVTQWELMRLLRTGFLDGKAERNFLKVVEEREKHPVDDYGNQKRVSRSGLFKKPANEEKGT